MWDPDTRHFSAQTLNPVIPAPKPEVEHHNHKLHVAGVVSPLHVWISPTQAVEFPVLDLDLSYSSTNTPEKKVISPLVCACQETGSWPCSPHTRNRIRAAQPCCLSWVTAAWKKKKMFLVHPLPSMQTQVRTKSPELCEHIIMYTGRQSVSFWHTHIKCIGRPFSFI